MLAKAAGMACVTTGLGATEADCARQMQKSIPTWVAKLRVLEVTIGRCEERLRGSWRSNVATSAQRVQLAERVTSKERHPGVKVLDGQNPKDQIPHTQNYLELEHE